MAKKAVAITSKGFSPDKITLASGDTIVFTNSDSVVHNANFKTYTPPGSTGDISPGASVETNPFTVAGTYEYSCDHHPKMKGTVTVS